jgi:N-acetylneuraminic acid mutarotase
VDTTLLSLAESTVVFFSGVVKTYRQGYFRRKKKIDYNIVNIKKCGDHLFN